MPQKGARSYEAEQPAELPEMFDPRSSSLGNESYEFQLAFRCGNKRSLFPRNTMVLG
jgi:hypothetical protein